MWQLLVLPCPTVTVTGHVQKHQPGKCMVIKSSKSQKLTSGSHYQSSQAKPARVTGEGEEIYSGEWRGEG